MPQHPTEEILNITRKFLGGDAGTQGQQLPRQASPVAQGRAFGQQGAQQRRKRPGESLPLNPKDLPSSGSLSDDFFDLPGPVSFSRTPQGRSLLQRILGLRGLR